MPSASSHFPVSASPPLRVSACIFYWILPLAVCLVVFRQGLLCWFQQDDFAWLQLELHSRADLWRMLAEPQAQGTIRPISERFFFLAFRRLFDLNALPYRLLVFLTQFANLLLLGALGRRLAGSAGAAAVAATLWVVNVGLAAPMAWTSTYNQVLCSLVYLGGLLLFVRHVETGRWSFYAWQCVVFLLGFGVLETIVAYPLALLAYCLLFERRQAWKALPLWIPSAVYTALHLWVIPRAAGGPYAFHADGSMLAGLWQYWSWALGPVRFARIAHLPTAAGVALALALTAGLAAMAARAGPNERRVAAFGLAWFVVTLAPILPLRDHRLDYYLAIPSIGLALAAGAVMRPAPRWAAAAWVAIYLFCSVTFVNWEVRASYRYSHLAQRFIQAVRQARALHPDQTILLTGVDHDLFYAVIYHRGLRAAGLRGVYLAPTNQKIAAEPGFLPSEDYQLPAGVALGALAEGRAVVYEVAGGRLHNITRGYTLMARARLAAGAPRRVDVGEPLLAGQLGAGWHRIQGEHRWMGRRAEVRLAGPRSAGERLAVAVIYPDNPRSSVFRYTVSVNGMVVGRAEVASRASVRREFSLPAMVVGLPEMTVALEAEHTFSDPLEARELGLALGVVELVGP
ncbi:MAG: hypothetical protein HY238_06880 [Acidobacteria bacterium]|nr:hypothetical protein [Acidobacteriota bacterium]